MKWSVMNVKERVVGGGTIGAGIVAVMTLYITPCLASDPEFYEVKLGPNRAPSTTMDVSVNPGRRCESNKHAGCMLFRESTLGVITFYVARTGTRMQNCGEATNRI